MGLFCDNYEYSSCCSWLRDCQKTLIIVVLAILTHTYLPQGFVCKKRGHISLVSQKCRQKGEFMPVAIVILQSQVQVGKCGKLNCHSPLN